MKVRIGPYRKNRAFNIEIEPFDTWSMDHTLAPIILPMLIQLKATQHGHPADLTEQEWDDVLDEMIYAFDCKANKDEVYMRFDIKDRDAMHKEQDRISNGFRLFGKYYENLWD